jgi:NADH-quinone oxidoreductase subunit G
VVPRQNEAINETWIADRDRFSYEGIYSPDRLLAPRIRDGATWKTVDWEQALRVTAEGLKARGASLGVLASPSATVEELYLAARLARGLGSSSIDHRLRQVDFSDAAGDPGAPSLGIELAAVDALTGLLVVGSHLRAEAPILAHRVRKAARRGARVALLNPAAFDYLFPVAAQLQSAPTDQLGDLLGVLAAIGASATLPEAWAERVRGVPASDAHRALAAALLNGERRAVWLGALALRHPAFADLRAVAAAIAQAAGATLGVISEGANSAGAWLAGAVPHREAGGAPAQVAGLDARAMLATNLRAYLMVGALDPGLDFTVAAGQGPAAAHFVVAITPYVTPELERLAHVLLPMGSFAETSGTFVNLEGRWQSFAGAAKPLGESRPGWKILRVLGNLVDLPQFDYQSSEEVRDELRAKCATAGNPLAGYAGQHVPASAASAPATVTEAGIYQVDAVVRRAPALQATHAGREPARSY